MNQEKIWGTDKIVSKFKTKKISEKLIEEILDKSEEQEDFGLKSLELKEPERALDWFEKPRDVR